MMVISVSFIDLNISELMVDLPEPVPPVIPIRIVFFTLIIPSYFS